MNELQALATIGGSLALIGGLAGSAIGIGLAATAGVATLSEDSGQLRNVVVLASLPMTQTFYGLIILIIILTVVIPNMPTSGSAGLAVAAVGTMGGAAELFSAIFQGSVCASGIALLPKTRGQILTSSMMLAVFVELIGVLGLVFVIMAFSILKLM
ncbi:MAG TPA: ATPase [Deltaproteobacteria bacterium]|jgi:V/A-type H+-transporting ATPase subunit K|nr:ATPase [Deltaproteobacteria bacterium]HPJ93545.1 ATPase [Deltaproteobacteria bacterium]HPR51082.1 ATPase [Deltaproteobacteria bacterium]